MDSKYSYVDHLYCPKCSKKYDAMKVNNLCTCGSPLWAKYDIEGLKENANKKEIAHRVANMWRYHEFLPVADPENVVTLGEGCTPLIKADQLGQNLGLDNLYIKNEGLNPTGTFKARGSAAGISKAKELGIENIAIPTNGNAGAAWATYAAKAGIGSYVVMPKNAPAITKSECTAAGAHLYLVDGRISDAGIIVGRLCEKYGYFEVSTLKEPYRLEGKKTMGYEIMEQMNWEPPDVILYPTGGGMGIIGIHKAMKELRDMGWIDGSRTRLVSVQAEGCAPIVEAWKQKKNVSEMWENSYTVAFGMNVPKSLGDFLVLDALYDTDGAAVAVSDEEILKTQSEIGQSEGMFISPEGASTITGLRKLIEDGQIDRSERVVALNTGAGLKYPKTINVDAPLLSPEEEIVL